MAAKLQVVFGLAFLDHGIATDPALALPGTAKNFVLSHKALPSFLTPRDRVTGLLQLSAKFSTGCAWKFSSIPQLLGMELTVHFLLLGQLRPLGYRGTSSLSTNVVFIAAEKWLRRMKAFRFV